MSDKKMDFGKFMSDLANSADAATAETLDGIKAKLQKEKQEKLETKLRSIFNHLEMSVLQLRRVRKQEETIKAQMKSLEALANLLVAGDDVEDNKELHAVAMTLGIRI